MLDLFNKHLLRTRWVLQEKAYVWTGGAGARGDAVNQEVSGQGALRPVGLPRPAPRGPGTHTVRREAPLRSVFTHFQTLLWKGFFPTDQEDEIYLYVISQIWAMWGRFGSNSSWVFLSNYFSLLLDLLGWHWLIKLYRFWVYSAITHHLYIVLCVCHPKSTLPSPSIAPLPSSTSPTPHPFPSSDHHTVVCFDEGFFFCILPLPSSSRPATPLPSDSCQSALWVCLCFPC